MRGSFGSLFARVAVVLLSAFLASSFAADAAKPNYLVTNDDVPPQNETSVTFYTVNANGLLTIKRKCPPVASASRAATSPQIA